MISNQRSTTFVIARGIAHPQSRLHRITVGQPCESRNDSSHATPIMGLHDPTSDAPPCFAIWAFVVDNTDSHHSTASAALELSCSRTAARHAPPSPSSVSPVTDRAGEQRSRRATARRAAIPRARLLTRPLRGVGVQKRGAPVRLKTRLSRTGEVSPAKFEPVRRRGLAIQTCWLIFPGPVCIGVC